METKFNFNSSVCTSKEQSEKLLALGLKKETADMCHFWHWASDDYSLLSASWERVHRSNNDIPAWSLHRLWELLPKSFWHDNGLEKKYHPIIEYDFVNYVTIDGMELFDLNYQKDVWESMIDCIEWLIKEGYFNKEYLV